MNEEDATLFGKIKDKLIASKEKWAREGRSLTGRHGRKDEERLPPGQRLVTNWPVLDLGVQPHVPLERWQLQIDGLVDHPVTLGWEEFNKLRQSESLSDIHCVTTWSRYDNHWRGVSAFDLIQLVKPQPAARYVIFHSYDNYTTNLPLHEFADEDVLLATHWEGKPITREHGGPVRVVVPKLYFWKSAKWVKRIEFSDRDRPGFWEVRGYHNHGDPWDEERYG
ncbi:MAG TPA: sulfite oxidase-like oxidoreductase [Dongiaceae bacterium]|jgi:DMSO/TMAO reductase YedYZ molybdopterin-dependent catalytic subunit|nr:sulfite oxidase-like oxidoreductase [Dongiaceae bacterium]